MYTMHTKPITVFVSFGFSSSVLAESATIYSKMWSYFHHLLIIFMSNKLVFKMSKHSEEISHSAQ